MAHVKIAIDKNAERDAEKILKQIDELVRGPAITKTLQSMGQAIKNDVRSVLPKPGYPGDKPQFKPLRETMSVKVKGYTQEGKIFKVLVVGYRWPSGAHGQPLESGHAIANQYGAHEGIVEPRTYLADTVERTKPAQARMMVEGARKMLEKVRGS